jgi:hypothetical protein
MRASEPIVPEYIRLEMEERTDWGDYFSEKPAVQDPAAASSAPR